MPLSALRSTVTRNPLVWTCAGTAVFAFFLPWAQLDLNMGDLEKSISKSMKSSVRKTFKKTRKAPKRARKGTPILLTTIRGYQIPIMANRKNAKVAMQLVKMFTKKDEQVGMKSWAVYLLPLVAVLCAWALSAAPRDAPALVGVAAVCAAVALGGAWFLATTDTRKEYAIVIGPGIWLSLSAYAGLAALAVRGLASRRQRRALPA